ncbi:MAG: chorismate lyase [Pseudomonadales bacterium]
MSNAQKTPQNGADLLRVDPWRVRPLPLPTGQALPYRHWIELTGSMTRELGARLGGTVQVTPSYEGPGRLAPWERRFLRARARQAYVREVTLSVAGIPVLGARTLSLLDDPAVDVLRRLSSRPLAEVLFEDRDWQRLTAPVPVIETFRGCVGRACVWGYRSRRRSGSRILVTEYFEPALAEVGLRR